MPIRQTTPMSQIDKYIQQLLKRQERALVNTLMYIGEKCVNAARANGSYTDQTGNLRSSIGYVVTVDGKIKGSSTFETVKEGEDGSKTGKDFAKELAAQYPQGVALIVVAGMHYAKYVAATGRDVLASAELEARNLIPKMLKQLEIEINNANSQAGTE